MEIQNKIYYEVKDYDNLPIIHVNDIGTFESLLYNYQPDFIFVSKQDHKITLEGQRDLIGRTKVSTKSYTEFAFYHNGLVYAVNGKNFKTLEDYKAGTDLGFEDGERYYLAQSFANREEFDIAEAAGFSEKEAFEEAQAMGFLGAINKLKQASAEGKISDKSYAEVKRLKTDAVIYELAKDLEYSDYDVFENAVAGGFVKVAASEFQEALGKGFNSYDSYARAKEGQFADSNEYAAAQSLGIADRNSYEQHNRLEQIRSEQGFRSIEQAHVFALLQEIEAGDSSAVNKLWDTLKEEQKGIATNSRSTTSWLDRPILELFGRSKLPTWYTTSFKDLVELKVFLISNENVGHIGTYDADGELFKKEESMAALEM